ncbi:hypothetical protein ACIRPS_17815 [Streptomyces griseoviridis]
MPEMINDSDKISSSLLGRMLAIPAKGQPQRKTAIGSYLGVAVALAAGTGFGILDINQSGPSTHKGAAISADDVKLRGDAYSETPQRGFESTYFDGAGGIAGVPLTEEQRSALIKEAERRGMSEDDAYALAYGDGSEATKTKDGKTIVDTKHVALADGPVYKRLAPSEQAQDTSVFQSGRAASPNLVDQLSPGKSDSTKSAPQPRQSPEKQKPKPQPGRRTEAKDGDKATPYYEQGRVDLDGNATPHTFSDDLHAVLPDPFDDVITALTPFSAWIDDLSAPGTTPDISVQPGPDGGVTMTAVAQVSDDITVTTHVVAPSPDDEHAPDPTVTVTVTDSQTGEVLSKSEPQAAESIDDVPRVAIGQVVDAVISASDVTHEDEDADLADAVQESGEDALDALPAEAGNETPQAPASGEPERSDG